MAGIWSGDAPVNSPPLIRELRIEGFKSFGTPAERIAFGPLNFVVGANASGKTNLLSALRFLQLAVLQNTEFAVNEFGGVAEVRNKILRQRESPKPLTIGFKLDTPGLEADFRDGKSFRIPAFDCTVSLDLRNDAGVPEVVQEDLVATIETENESSSYRLHRDRQAVEIVDPTEGGRLTKAQPRNYEVPELEAKRLAIGVGFFSLPCVLLRTIIEGWRFYDINPLLARRPAKETPDVDLGAAGENLAVILHKLEQENGTGALSSVISGIRGAVPGFRGIRTTRLPVEGTWAFQVLEEKIRGAINPASVSDGTIRLLALMVIANWTAKQSSLIAIEEPENGIHPHLSDHIVQVLRTASEERQLIVTTHNPAFLDHLEPQEVILCDKKEGFTKVHRASDVEQIDTFRKRFQLGELWMQGVLEGIP